MILLSDWQLGFSDGGLVFIAPVVVECLFENHALFGDCRTNLESFPSQLIVSDDAVRLQLTHTIILGSILAHQLCFTSLLAGLGVSSCIARRFRCSDRRVILPVNP